MTVYISRIAKEMSNMHELRRAATTAQTMNIQTIVKDTGKVAASLYESFDRASLAMGISMELINERLSIVEVRTDRMCFALQV